MHTPLKMGDYLGMLKNQQTILNLVSEGFVKSILVFQKVTLFRLVEVSYRMRQPSFDLECIGVPVQLQIGKLNSEGRAGLLLASWKWKAHNRWVCASVRGESPRLPFSPHCQYGKCGNCCLHR